MMMAQAELALSNYFDGQNNFGRAIQNRSKFSIYQK
tara:strand:+ start:48 stop:155 length:108 start_codon:yes stop_codon:yes gene_type:complete